MLVTTTPSLPRPRRDSGTGRRPFGRWPDLIPRTGCIRPAYSSPVRVMRSGQRPNGLLPVPLSRLGRGNEGVVVTSIHDARVSCDVRGSQEHTAALVGADRLEMTEGVAHEVDRRALERQCFGAVIREDPVSYTHLRAH